MGGDLALFRRPGEIVNSGSLGRFAFDLDLSSFPSLSGPISVVAGETWHFQAWHRDFVAGPTSHYTDAVEIMIR